MSVDLLTEPTVSEAGAEASAAVRIAEALAGHRTLRLVKAEERERWRALSRICTSCAHISSVRGSAGRSGWCMKHRLMVSDTHPVLCLEYRSA